MEVQNANVMCNDASRLESPYRQDTAYYVTFLVQTSAGQSFEMVASYLDESDQAMID